MNKKILTPIDKLKDQFIQIITMRTVAATAIGALLLVIVAVGDVEAASHAIPLTTQSTDSLICDGSGNPTFLGNAVQAGMRFVTYSAVPVLVLLYSIDGLMELFALGADTKAKIKKHERNLWMGAAKIYVAPIGIWLFAGAIGVDFGNCIKLLPFA